MNHSPLTVATLRLVGLIREVDGPDPHLFSEFWLNRGLRQCEASPCHLAEIIRNGHQASPERSNQNMCKLSALLFRQSQRSVRTENLERVISVFIVKRRFALLGSCPSRASDLLRWALSPPHGERNDGSGCYPALEAIKGSVNCVHQFRRPLLSSQERPSLQAPLRSRRPILRHRRPTRSRRDRSRYPGQMSRR